MNHPDPKSNGLNHSETDHQEQSFGIHKIYTKDISFESPNTLEMFQMEEWKPQVHLDLHTKTEAADDDMHEVVLTLTVTAKAENGKVAFLAEVKQAGLFYLVGFPKEELKHMLGSFCPSILFPYGREVISNLVSRGGFPPLYLAPINFDMLYQHHLEQEGKN